MAKRLGAQYWQWHLDAWRQSGLTQIAYCARHGLSVKAFYRWRRKGRDVVASATSSLTLVPVSVGAPATGNLIRLHSPGGWRIELPAGGAVWLADLLRHLP